MTKAKSIQSSISNDWLFWSVNHTSIYENSLRWTSLTQKSPAISQMIYREQIHKKPMYVADN